MAPRPCAAHTSGILRRNTFEISPLRRQLFPRYLPEAYALLFPCRKLFAEIEKGEVKGDICLLTFPILFYLLLKEIGRVQAAKTLEKIRIIFKVAAVDEKIIDLSLASDFVDFEGASQYYAAMQAGVICLISRDKGDFTDKRIPVDP